ncbi:MAG: hypothetical protein EOP51_18595 [Sphingobacteriales bacterium]|nr:MAG: hypothetical protein EOP51_18595 [Sphingobacteriales bacterium]
MVLNGKRSTLLITVYITAVITLNGCKKADKTGLSTGPVTNTEINTWMLDSLKRYYYWADNLPANTINGNDPIAYFKYVKNNADRFSFITLPGSETSLQATSRSKYGFDYLVFTEPVNGQVLGVITLALSNSPAQTAGLKRGRYFTRINGTQLTNDNIEELQSQLLKNSSVQLMQASYEDGVIKETGTANILEGRTFEENSIAKVFDNGGKKIAYLYFTQFNNTDREAYTGVFADYKAAGVTDIILDMRYNSGGDVAAAAALCSMLAPGINAASPFIEYRGNKNGGIRKESFRAAAEAFGGPAFAELQQQNLTLTKIYALTTGATASAAELVLNNLKPYITVIQIGTKTRGKDEASITISDKRDNKRIDWVMYPIVYKLYNALGTGGYANGIPADISMPEADNLPLQPFGNEFDPMIQHALKIIRGEAALQLKQTSPHNSFSVQPGELFNSAVKAAGEKPLLAR